MKCRKCGREASAEDLFCKKCGSSLAEDITNELPEEDKQSIPTNSGSEESFIMGAKLKNEHKQKDQSFNFTYVDNDNKSSIPRPNLDLRADKKLSIVNIFVGIVVTIFLAFGIYKIVMINKMNFNMYGSWENKYYKFNWNKPKDNRLKFSWFLSNGTSFSGTYSIYAYENKDQLIDKAVTVLDKEAKEAGAITKEFAEALNRQKELETIKDNDVYIVRLKLLNFFDGEKDVAKTGEAVMGVLVSNNGEDMTVIIASDPKDPNNIISGLRKVKVE